MAEIVCTDTADGRTVATARVTNGGAVTTTADGEEHQGLVGPFEQAAWAAAEAYLARADAAANPAELVDDSPSLLLPYFPERWRRLAFRVVTHADKLRAAFKRGRGVTA